MKDRALWDRLASYGFPLTAAGQDLAAVVGVRLRLRGAKVAPTLEEYRRFLYLAATAGETVAPSPLIDKVWHLHIEDMRAYLGDLCEGVIGRVLHHSPGRPAAKDDPAYARTLALYREEFGGDPPGTVWPGCRERRAEAMAGGLFIGGLAVGALVFFTTGGGPWGHVLMFGAVGLGFVVAGRWGSWSVSTGGGDGCGGDAGGCGGD